MGIFWFSAMGQQQGEKFNCAPTSFGGAATGNVRRKNLLLHQRSK